MRAVVLGAALLVATVVATPFAFGDVPAPQDPAASPDAAAPAAAPDAAAAPAAGAPDAAATPEAASSAMPSPVEVHARLEPDTTTIGTPFRYVMEIRAPAGLQVVFAQPTEKLGPFDIRDYGDKPPVTENGFTTVTRWYELTGWEPGHYELESPPVAWRREGGDLVPAPQTKVVMTIESMLAKAGAPTDIRDVMPPIEPPFYWTPYYALAAAIGGIILIAYVAYRVARRRRHVAPAAPPRPAHEVALEELERLRGRRLTDSGLFKEYYSALSGIVRRYVERRFAVRAPEMTTEEFLLTSARGGALQGPHRALLGEFLVESDLVKFAKLIPTIADSERAWAAARRFVDETAPAATAPPEEIRAAG